MAQQTSLSVIATSGKTQSFSAKQQAQIFEILTIVSVLRITENLDVPVLITKPLVTKAEITTEIESVL